ncbi:protein FAR-RED ELONGATED HYPOCOTYL 1-like isoform X3 [Abrus precatorius]|uniref:Protein FAR-RED ELONGATED HYPOCOTYL 1-like isoform X3 n=1 Tax=Abrus precatorius TaxID=3816 RepID=A0A8B8K1C0_ABRPR|nr:protein FAR-RED ELONGATED HYPOCOTYL 1-like isoform X3 [Abrus precatorius]
MDADIHNPSQGYRFCVDGVHETNIAEWNKKRKLQSDELDLPRPKHKCWLGNSSSEHASMFEENRALESMQIYVLEDRTGADSSEPESAKDSNSFTEDSNTAMSVNEEDEKGCSGEADTFVDKECNPSYHYADIQALKNLEEQILELENRSNHVCQEYAEDVDMEFEDFLFAQGGNRNMYVLSSGRWSVNQEAQSSTRPPTIDQEFEQYFSMLML